MIARQALHPTVVYLMYGMNVLGGHKRKKLFDSLSIAFQTCYVMSFSFLPWIITQGDPMSFLVTLKTLTATLIFQVLKSPVHNYCISIKVGKHFN